MTPFSRLLEGDRGGGESKRTPLIVGSALNGRRAPQLPVIIVLFREGGGKRRVAVEAARVFAARVFDLRR